MPRTPVVARPATPPRVGLITSTSQPNDGDARWWTGFGYQPEGCGPAGVADPCATGSLDIPDGGPQVEFEPFLVWAADKCSTWGFDARDYQGRAERLIAACEGAQIENEFWTGAFAQAEVAADAGSPFAVNDYLAHGPNSDVVTAGPATASEALSVLEQALGSCNCGQQGMIHATRGVASLWYEAGAIRRDGNLLLTVNDTIVVPGAGYDGSDPDGNPAVDGSVWAYATSMVQVRRGPVTVDPTSFDKARDRGTNTFTVLASRPAAVTFDPCCTDDDNDTTHFAAEINAPMPNFLGAGS